MRKRDIAAFKIQSEARIVTAESGFPLYQSEGARFVYVQEGSVVTGSGREYSTFFNFSQLLPVSMRLETVAAVVVVVLAVSCAAEEKKKEKVKKLQIGVKKRVDNCTLKSR
ncbi:hypothetical protein O3P69_002908 [Scylla paramamosain]|uniref:Uncharacterized protein n=1 Tax=Scylla paramamosain TaxID=85552 RepID=A0AAW0UMW2_SCYPA